MSIKRLHEQSLFIISDAQEIEKDLFRYNPSFKKDKRMPLENIQQALASLARSCVELYADIGKEIKDGD